jgi:hypothetical protein
MTIGAYSALLERVQLLLDGEGATAGSGAIDSATLDAVVNMAENRIYRDVRSRYNQKDFTALTTTSNAITIPTDLIAVTKIWITGEPLEATTEEFVRKFNANGSTGNVQFYAQAGSKIIFAPTVADGTTINGRYWAKLPELKTNFSNAMFQAYEDLFVYACLLEGEQFWPLANTPKWAQFYIDIKESIISDEKNAIYSGSTIKRKPSVGLYR